MPRSQAERAARSLAALAHELPGSASSARSFRAVHSEFAFQELFCGMNPLSVARRLHFKHFGVTASRLQLIVTAFFGNTSILQHDDSLSHSDRRKAMRDEERHFAFCQFVESLEYLVFSPGIERRSWFVKYQNLRLPQIGAAPERAFAIRPRKGPRRLQTAARAFARSASQVAR